MLSATLFPMFSMQLPLADAGELLLVMAVTFIVITFIVSTSRFHQMIKTSEKDLKTPQDCNDFFSIQITRNLFRANRESSGFVLLIFEFESDEENLRPLQERIFNELNQRIRKNTDKACLYEENCVGLILDADDNKREPIALRLMAQLKAATQDVAAIKSLRLGVSAFPLNGSLSTEILDAAKTALQQADAQSVPPIAYAEEIDDNQIAEAEESGEAGELSKQDKHSALDPLTGVLSPKSVSSYMRKYLLELRREKKPATLLCIGINRLDPLIELHGEEAADAVIAGVSQITQSILRETDLIGRYHRADFMALSPCCLVEGEHIAVRIRDAVKKETFHVSGKRIKTSVSIGISAHPEHGRTLRDLFRGAYAALEEVRKWETSSCLTYDPTKHKLKG